MFSFFSRLRQDYNYYQSRSSAQHRMIVGTYLCMFLCTEKFLRVEIFVEKIMQKIVQKIVQKIEQKLCKNWGKIVLFKCL